MLAANRQTAPATWAALVQLFGEENARYHLERSAAIITVTPAMLHTHWAVLVAVFGEEVRPCRTHLHGHRCCDRCRKRVENAYSPRRISEMTLLNCATRL